MVVDTVLIPVSNTHTQSDADVNVSLQKSSSCCVSQRVPVADLLTLGLFHLSPVSFLLLTRTVEPQGDPTQPLPGPQAAAAGEHCQDQRDLGQLEERNLERKRLLVGGIGLATAHSRFTLGYLFAFGVQHGQLHISVWKQGRGER